MKIESAADYVASMQAATLPPDDAAADVRAAVVAVSRVLSLAPMLSFDLAIPAATDFLDVDGAADVRRS